MHLKCFLCCTFQPVSQYKLPMVYIYKYIFLGPTPPSGPWPPHSQGLYIIHNDAPQSVGLLWTSDQPVAETST